MRNYLLVGIITLNFFHCATKIEKQNTKKTIESDYTIAFGSCNKQNKKNILWKEISKNNPDLWVWGGDIIYSDT